MEEDTPIASASDKGKTSVQRSVLDDKTQVPLVSVVIPTYNSAQYLPETIESVLSQSWQDFEIIIVDDGSTDNTQEIVEAFNSTKIRYIRQENSGGPSKPRNVGVHHARGKYISLFDSDDLMSRNKLAQAVAFLERYSDLGLLFANFEVCNERGESFPGTFLDEYQTFRDLPKRQVDEKWFIIESEVAYNGLLSQNFIGTSGTVVPKAVFLSVGGFDENIAGPEDRDMWLRISRRYALGYLDIVGHRYRRRETGIMGRGGAVLAPYRVLVMRKQLETGLPFSLRRQVRRNIAQSMFELGYHYRSIGDLKQARAHYRSSLKESFSVVALRGLLISCLGKRLIAFLKECRERGSGLLL
jgi:glycosyltransferase involved in cell wall biosynthesis